MKLFVQTFVTLFLLSSIHGEVSMPSIFGDHMVLQQGAFLPVWGTADPGEEVTVSFVGQKVTTKANEDGRWRVNLRPVYLRSAPDVLTIDGKNHLEFVDVLVGDVWLCSGGSNMAFSLSKADHGEEEIARARDSLLRLFVVEEKAALQPEQNIRGSWQLCTPEAVANFSAVGYFFGRDLRARLEMPIGLIGSYYHDSPIQAWISLKALREGPSFSHDLANYIIKKHDLPLEEQAYAKRQEEYQSALMKWKNNVEFPYHEALQEWRKQCEEALQKLRAQPLKPEPDSPQPEPPQPPDTGRDLPSSLFNGMIAPLIPYAIKGAIWYQGEANDGPVAALEYRRLFLRLIRSWRAAWEEGPFPFYFVSLASHNKPSAEIVESLYDEEETPNPSWAWLRESQEAALSLPETAMVTATDLGDPDNICPEDKLDIGKRLAFLVRKKIYGENLIASGPVYRSMNIEKNKVRLFFDSLGNGLTIGAPPWSYDGIIPFSIELTGFAIAGANHRWVPATAIIEGDNVIVFSELIDHPQAVRYNWANNAQGNLYNKNGLPAAPFRTDQEQPK